MDDGRAGGSALRIPDRPCEPLSQQWATQLLAAISATPAFCVYGRANYEPKWRVISVFAVRRRDPTSIWPLLRNHATALTTRVVTVGWDFANRVVQEQNSQPATRDRPVRVAGGRLRDGPRRQAAGWPDWYSCSELLAHECGHTGQARTLGFLYWPLLAGVTLFREGPRWWQRLENQASETGEFGGIVPGTIHPKICSR